jgi:uncharacterized protein (DUF58 family)
VPWSIQEAPLPDIAPGGSNDAIIRLLPMQRGKLDLPHLIIARSDPLGLLRSFWHYVQAEKIVILPRRYPLPALELAGNRRYHLGGVSLAHSIGESEEFVAMRDYRPGDPLRRVHWRSWAKAGKPIVKEYQNEYFVRHALILDTFISESISPLFEEAVAIAASFLCTFETQESLLDLIFIGLEAYCFTMGRGQATVDAMLEILAAVQTCPAKPFQDIIPVVLERIHLFSSTICVLLGWDAPRQEFVRLLRMHGLPLIVLVISAEETSLNPGPMADCIKNFHCLRIDRIAEGLGQL